MINLSRPTGNIQVGLLLFVDEYLLTQFIVVVTGHSFENETYIHRPIY